MTIEKINSDDPKERIQHIEKYISELKQFCHEEIRDIANVKAQVLLETTTDVLEGIEKALSDFQSENSGAWVNDEDRPTLN